MAKSTRTQKLRDAGRSASENPYVRRLVEDQELRENIRNAFDSARKAYGRMQNGKGPAQALLDDKKVQKELQQAARSLRTASDQLRGKSGGGFPWGKVLLVGIVGAILALVLSDDLRKTVLDKLFGAEEEFEYTSTTASETPEPQTTE
jgi:hypothetical protein